MQRYVQNLTIRLIIIYVVYIIILYRHGEELGLVVLLFTPNFFIVISELCSFLL